MTGDHDPSDFSKAWQEFLAFLSNMRAPLPPRYQRALSEGCFEHCEFCGVDLVSKGRLYYVNKYYVDDQPQFELAYCQRCLQDLQNKYSNQSKQAIMDLLDLPAIGERLKRAFNAQDRLAAYTACCTFCGTPRRELEAHYEIAQCEADKIIFRKYPTLMCIECTKQYLNVLSKETLDARNRFFEEHFGFPPTGGKEAELKEHYARLFL
jgi:hypothetical protein